MIVVNGRLYEFRGMEVKEGNGEEGNKGSNLPRCVLYAP